MMIATMKRHYHHDVICMLNTARLMILFSIFYFLCNYVLEAPDGDPEGEEPLLLLPVVVLEEAVVVVGVIPLAVSRQFVTTLCVRPSVDLLAVFMQLMNELSSFLVNALGLAVVAEEDEEVPPMVNPPPVLPLLLPPPLLFFETANAV
jgi:hypothetical protein